MEPRLRGRPPRQRHGPVLRPVHRLLREERQDRRTGRLLPRQRPEEDLLWAAGGRGLRPRPGARPGQLQRLQPVYRRHLHPRRGTRQRLARRPRPPGLQRRRPVPPSLAHLLVEQASDVHRHRRPRRRRAPARRHLDPRAVLPRHRRHQHPGPVAGLRPAHRQGRFPRRHHPAQDRLHRYAHGQPGRQG